MIQCNLLLATGAGSHDDQRQKFTEFFMGASELFVAELTEIFLFVCLNLQIGQNFPDDSLVNYFLLRGITD